MSRNEGAKAPLSNTLFDNLNDSKKTVDENDLKNIEGLKRPSIIDSIFNRLERVCLLLWGDFFNEVDVARLFRLPDPEGKGKDTIRNYALRSKKLPFAKAGRNGLLFHREDCEKLFHSLRNESFDDFLN